MRANSAQYTPSSASVSHSHAAAPAGEGMKGATASGMVAPAGIT